MKLLCLYLICLAALSGEGALALRIVKRAESGTPLLQNGGFEEVRERQPTHWRGWQQGFRLASGEGREGTKAVVCERREGEGEFGASQTLALNRTNIAPLAIRGWSKAENVSGSLISGAVYQARGARRHVDALHRYLEGAGLRGFRLRVSGRRTECRLRRSTRHRQFCLRRTDEPLASAAAGRAPHLRRRAGGVDQ